MIYSDFQGTQPSLLGFGTMRLPTKIGGSIDEAQVAEMTAYALEHGMNYFDTANAYMNERAVGRAMRKSGVAREDIFLSSKIWASEYEKENAVEKALEILEVEYIDLLYIHQPSDNYMAGYRLPKKPTRKERSSSSAFPISTTTSWSICSPNVRSSLM